MKMTSYGTNHHQSLLGNKHGSHDSLTTSEDSDASSIPCMEITMSLLRKGMTDCAGGVLIFLMTSTTAVSCASVITGHSKPLTDYVSDFISMNFLGTAILCIVLAGFSSTPWIVGSMDAFIAPILAGIAHDICLHLNYDMRVAIPTTIVAIALTSALLGVGLYLMGFFRLARIANYMPFPVMAGFLSGIGATLVRNGVLLTSTVDMLLLINFKDAKLLIPAITLAICTRWAVYKGFHRAPVFFFIFLVSVLGFHLTTFLMGVSLSESQIEGWLFDWTEKMLKDKSRWFAWSEVSFTSVRWHAIYSASAGHFTTMLVLGCLKNSVTASSIATILERDISPDSEMRALGKANFFSGVLGANGGTYYLAAIGMLHAMRSNEKRPTYICALLYGVMWFTGFKALMYIPKFVFGGLLIDIGMQFIEKYLILPAFTITRTETLTICAISLGFVTVGMLPSVVFGILVSKFVLIYRVHSVGCIRQESTGSISRSSVDRNDQEFICLQHYGNSIYILRLQGFIFFGTSISVVERVKARVEAIDLPKLCYVVLDFGLVPSIDTTALCNFKKMISFTCSNSVKVIFSGLPSDYQKRLERSLDSRQFLSVLFYTDVDLALEICEEKVLDEHIAKDDRARLLTESCLDTLFNVQHLWEKFLSFDANVDVASLLPIYKFLEPLVSHAGDCFDFVRAKDEGPPIYFICDGEISIWSPSNVGEVFLPNCADTIEPSTNVIGQRKMVRIRKAKPGSILGKVEYLHYCTSVYGAQCDFVVGSKKCILLRLSASSLEQITVSMPQAALSLLSLLDQRIARRFHHSNSRISQLTNLLYSDRHSPM